MDDKILWLYAQGMSTRDTVQAFDEWHGADLSPTLVSRVTNAVGDQVVEWQSRPLDAINAVYPDTHVQLCIVHIVRNSLNYVSWKNYKEVTSELKRIYQSATEDEALLELDRFSDTWDGHYPQISKSWRNHWHNLNTFFNYPQGIRKAIYTTNAIESLIAIKEASKKWSMPIRNWRTAMNRFIIEFEDRLEKHIN